MVNKDTLTENLTKKVLNVLNDNKLLTELSDRKTNKLIKNLKSSIRNGLNE